MPDQSPEQVAIERIKKTAQTGAQELDLSGLYLPTLPPELWQLAKLTSLNLSNNQITVLPSEIDQLTKLTSLNLDNNQLTVMPPEIGQLTKLTSLYLRDNQLTALPPEIYRRTNLTWLFLDNNRFTTLRPEIGQLANLTSLSLSFNKLIALPIEIGQLTNLTWLNLSYNQLTVLPTSIIKLTQLQRLDLRKNKLSGPPEILEKVREPLAIINYFSRLLENQKRPLAETKLLVVGQGSVGKTSLIRRLTGLPFDTRENKTDGIAINRWQVPNQAKAEDPIRLNLWDFGGQEIMHATHQFFLTRRSLYLLVLDARLTQEENRVEYWLKIIQSFSDDSPVLIVGNKIDQHPLDIDRTGIQKKYPNIVAILETSAATGAGLTKLAAAIAEQVNNLPHVRDLLPESWFNLKSRLETLGCEQNFISHERYTELCAANEVDEEISQHTLLGFLHDLGVILHFQDDPRLEALGILNPQWVTNGVYKILNAPTLFQTKGVIQRAMLDDILNFPEYPANKRLFIIDMMRKFELCYDIELDQTFLVPDLLPKDEPPTGGWEDALAFQYHYTVLPSSIFTRFIVRMNTFIHETVWRTGVVLKNADNLALLKADNEEHTITILVSGPRHKRRDFLAKIRGEFDALHKTIARIEAREKVPVPGHPEAEPIDYELLMKLEHKNVEAYPVIANGEIIMINVPETLNGIESEASRKAHIENINIYVGNDLSGNLTIGDGNKSTRK